MKLGAKNQIGARFASEARSYISEAGFVGDCLQAKGSGLSPCHPAPDPATLAGMKISVLATASLLSLSLLAPSTALAERPRYGDPQAPSTPHHASPYRPQAQPEEEARERAERRRSVLVLLPIGVAALTLGLVLVVGKKRK